MRRATRGGRRFSSQEGSAPLQQPKPRENEFQPHIPAVLRRNFSLSFPSLGGTPAWPGSHPALFSELRPTALTEWSALPIGPGVIP